MALSLYSSPAMTAYVLVVTGILGLVMGSFLNCLAWRITHGESVLHGRSHCTTCNHVLGPADLIPVLSWLFSKGRCRYCGERVSARYPITELVCAAVYVAIVARYDLTAEALELVAFSSVLLVLTLTDLDSFLIPNGCIVAAIVIRIAYLLFVGFTVPGSDPVALVLLSLAGGLEVGLPLLVAVLIMDRVLKKPSMGGGDLKLLAVAGMYFAWMECLFLVLVACVLGIVVAFVQLARERDGANGAGGDADSTADAEDEGNVDATEGGFSVVIPWGPSIAVACVITMLVGHGVTSWYLSLF